MNNSDTMSYSEHSQGIEEVQTKETLSDNAVIIFYQKY